VTSRQYKFYNQNNYAHVPYPSSNLPKATVKSGGCGVVSASMIVENLTGQAVPPDKMAPYAISKGARVAGGTDMNVMAKSISSDYGLTFKTTNEEKLLSEHLKKGHMAIANVGGNRSGYVGVFSDGGHYVVVAGLTSDGKVIVLDPGYYVGKFNMAGRKGKVTVQGNNCICDMAVLAKDTENRSPAYWLFERKVEEVPEWMKKLMDKCGKAGIIDPNANHDPYENSTKWFVLAVMVNLALIMLKAIKSPAKHDELIKILES
jgi:hypothetical protein